MESTLSEQTVGLVSAGLFLDSRVGSGRLDAVRLADQDHAVGVERSHKGNICGGGSERRAISDQDLDGLEVAVRAVQ